MYEPLHPRQFNYGGGYEEHDDRYFDSNRYYKPNNMDGGGGGGMPGRFRGQGGNYRGNYHNSNINNNNRGGGNIGSGFNKYPNNRGGATGNISHMGGPSGGPSGPGGLKTTKFNGFNNKSTYTPIELKPIDFSTYKPPQVNKSVYTPTASQLSRNPEEIKKYRLVYMFEFYHTKV